MRAFFGCFYFCVEHWSSKTLTSNFSVPGGGTSFTSTARQCTCRTRHTLPVSRERDVAVHDRRTDGVKRGEAPIRAVYEAIRRQGRLSCIGRPPVAPNFL